MLAKNRTFHSGVIALSFLVLTFIIVRIGANLRFAEHDYWIGYLGFGILLGVSYLSVHFLLKTLLLGKPHLARVCSQIIAAIVALPLTILAGFLSFMIVSAMIASGKEILDYLIDLSAIVLLLACPAFFLWRYGMKALKGEPNHH